MRALTFHGPGCVRCETVPDPAPEGAGDVVVEVELTAICGSDLHPYRGHETGLDVGTVLGHEFVGRVVAVGAGVTRWRVGDAVVAPFTTSCGTCYFCRSGLTCRCERGELFGWVANGRGLHGAQAQFVRVPLADSTLVGMPADLSREEVLFCGDVLSTGMSCAAAADVAAGKSAAVIGCGPVGLMAVVACLHAGAEQVFAIDVVPERLALARGFGAVPVAAGTAEPREVVAAATSGRGVDCVLEAVGSPEASRLAFDLVRAGGTIAACGVHTEATFAFSPGEAYDKNLTYRAGRSPARAFLEPALALVQSGRYRLEPIVSHRLSLEAGPRAYEMFDRKLDGCTKVLLIP